MLCNELHICSLQRVFYTSFFCLAESKGNRIKDKIQKCGCFRVLSFYCITSPSSVLCPLSDVKDALNPVHSFERDSIMTLISDCVIWLGDWWTLYPLYTHFASKTFGCLSGCQFKWALGLSCQISGQQYNFNFDPQSIKIMPRPENKRIGNFQR